MYLKKSTTPTDKNFSFVYNIFFMVTSIQNSENL